MRENTIVCVFGRKGEGKTTLVREMLTDFDRITVADTVGQYGPGDGCMIRYSREECVTALVALSGQRRFRLSCRCVDPEDMLAVLHVSYEVPEALVIVEETSLYCSPAHLPNEIARLVRYGRHRSISQFYVSQRPAGVHRDLTSQADLIVSFRQREPRDLAYMRLLVGESADQLPYLQPFEIMVWGDKSKAPVGLLARMRKRLTTRGKVI